MKESMLSQKEQRVNACLAAGVLIEGGSAAPQLARGGGGDVSVRGFAAII